MVPTGMVGMVGIVVVVAMVVVRTGGGLAVVVGTGSVLDSTGSVGWSVAVVVSMGVVTPGIPGIGSPKSSATKLTSGAGVGSIETTSLQ